MDNSCNIVTMSSNFKKRHERFILFKNEGISSINKWNKKWPKKNFFDIKLMKRETPTTDIFMAHKNVNKRSKDIFSLRNITTSSIWIVN